MIQNLGNQISAIPSKQEDATSTVDSIPSQSGLEHGTAAKLGEVCQNLADLPPKAVEFVLLDATCNFHLSFEANQVYHG